MNRQSMFVKVGRLCLALVMALATIMAPHPQIAHARSAHGLGQESRATYAVWEESGDGADDEIERWWGAAGAVLCGAEIRLIRIAPAIGMNPYVLAAGIGGCLLAVMDVMTTQ